MKLLAVRPARQHRVALLTDEAGEVLLYKRTFEESPYGVGSSLSAQEWEALLLKSEQDRLAEKAVFLLSRRDYSKRELEQKLCREKGRYCPQNAGAAAEAAQAMAQKGYVNDEAYAARLAREYQTVRLYPRRRAVEALCQKGIARDLAQQAVAALNLEDSQLALEFWHKKRYNRPQSNQEAEKQAAALMRYGFSYEAVRFAMKEAEYGD